MEYRRHITARSLLASLIVLSLSSIADGTGTAAASDAQTQKPTRSSTRAKEKSKAQVPDHFLLTGIVFREDGSAWTNLQVLLIPFDKETGKSQTQIGFALNPETGFIEPGNPHAKTDDQGRFSMKVPRVYLNKDAAETPFLIGRLKFVRGSSELIHLRKKGSDDALLLKVKPDLRTLDVGEVW